MYWRQTKMNEVTATIRYLCKLYHIFREKGFNEMIDYEFAATGISIIQRAENLDLYIEDRKKFKESQAEQNFQRFKESWCGFPYEQERYDSWVEDRQRRYNEQIREPAKIRRNERLEWICSLEEDEVELMIHLMTKS